MKSETVSTFDFETRLFPDCGVGGGQQKNQALRLERMKRSVFTICCFVEKVKEPEVGLLLLTV